MYHFYYAIRSGGDHRAIAPPLRHLLVIHFSGLEREGEGEGEKARVAAAAL